MLKVITDEKQVDELLDRSVEIIYPNRKDLKKLLMSGEQIKLYCGYDPSASSLHIGNAISINKLSQFQKLGHKVIFLIGDFTGMIGDPTDKGAARKKLTRKEVLENAKNYEKQAGAFLDFQGDNPAEIKYNSEWSDKITFKDLIELSSNFTVQQMIQRDMFQDRIENEKPIYLHEFLYPLAQGNDSVAMDVDLELGGNDQMFNMMAGRDLMKALGKKEKFVMTLKLLADDSGKKMGKTEGNAVFLDQDPSNMYGIIMSWPDGVIGTAFEFCTQLPMEEIKEINKQLKDPKVNPRDLKMKLAKEITRIFHNEKDSELAEENFIKTVQKKEVPEDIESKKLKVKSMNIIDLLMEVGLVSSKGEARRLIQQNGIKINGEPVKDVELEVDLKEEKLLQRGKRQFVKVVM
jgi:tyrosyl-tRNA synthetase